MPGIAVYGYTNAKFSILKTNHPFNLHIYFLKWKYKGSVTPAWDFHSLRLEDNV